MKQAKIQGDILVWRDILHDGPVPDGLTLEELSIVRGNFIVSRGWGEADEISQSFIERDNTLKSFGKYDRIILWFEHDLYDQLQLLQILDWFYQNGTQETKLSLICEEKYLGPMSPEEMKAMFAFESPVTDDQLQLANKAWSAFCFNSPERWIKMLKQDTTALPFLCGTISRMLEEYPDTTMGLSRTARQALAVISKGEKLPAKIFGACQELEERIFLGDSSFWLILHAFLASNPPLLNLSRGKSLTLPVTPDQELLITQAGLDVLDGKLDWLEIVDLDRWIGGVHLNTGNVWRYNSGNVSKING